MTIVRFNPMKDLISMQEKMSKIFDDSFKSSAGEWTPAVDILENDKEIMLVCEIPGVSEDDIDIQMADGVLVIKGEKKLPEDAGSDKYYRLERSYGKFGRSFAVPRAVDSSEVKASLKDGILKITLFKKGETKPKSIKIEKE